MDSGWGVKIKALMFIEAIKGCLGDDNKGGGKKKKNPDAGAFWVWSVKILLKKRGLLKRCTSTK